jgi:hypothetical protein
MAVWGGFLLMVLREFPGWGSTIRLGVVRFGLAILLSLLGGYAFMMFFPVHSWTHSFRVGRGFFLLYLVFGILVTQTLVLRWEKKS